MDAFVDIKLPNGETLKSEAKSKLAAMSQRSKSAWCEFKASRFAHEAKEAAITGATVGGAVVVGLIVVDLGLRAYSKVVG